MKVRFKCPIVVDVLPEKLKTPRKIVLTTYLEFDMAQYVDGHDAVEVARCSTPMSETKTKRVLRTEDGYLTPVVERREALDVTKPILLGSLLSNRVAERTAAAVTRIVREKVERFTAPPHGTKPEDLLHLPDIERYEGKLVNPQAYETEVLAISEIVKEYAVVGNILHRRIGEPFYAVSMSEPVSAPGSTPYVAMHLVTDSNPSASTIACFKLGRLSDALDFVHMIEQSGARPALAIHHHRDFVESADAMSDFPDLEMTVAMAAKRTSEAFKSSFDLFRQPRESFEAAVYDVPIGEIETARKLHAATKGKSTFDLCEDTEYLFGLLEEAAAYGDDSRFTRETLPLAAIISLWEDRKIDIDLPSPARRTAP
ncbi:hypothetical protein O9X98_04690 [Agrobacterium salinitolerans]|nr:hypothetical protein [Agrobacterium salinitolerans]